MIQQAKEIFRYSIKVDMNEKHDIIEQYDDFLKINQETKYGFKLCESCWTMISKENVHQHASNHPDHELKPVKSILSLLKYARNSGKHLNKLRGQIKILVLPGLDMEQFPPLIHYGSTSLIAKKKKDYLNMKLKWKDDNKELLEPGINMKLLKLYNTHIHSFSDRKLTTKGVRDMIRQTTDSLNKVYLH